MTKKLRIAIKTRAYGHNKHVKAVREIVGPSLVTMRLDGISLTPEADLTQDQLSALLDYERNAPRGVVSVFYF